VESAATTVESVDTEQVVRTTVDAATAEPSTTKTTESIDTALGATAGSTQEEETTGKATNLRMQPNVEIKNTDEVSPLSESDKVSDAKDEVIEKEVLSKSLRTESESPAPLEKTTAIKEEEIIATKSTIQEAATTHSMSAESVEALSFEALAADDPTFEPTAEPTEPTTSPTGQPTSQPSSRPTNLRENEELIDEFTTDIITAVKSGSVAAVEKVIEEIGAGPIVANNLAYTGAVNAIFLRSTSVLETLITKTDLSIDAVGKLGNSVLMWAAIFGDDVSAQWLLEFGADPTILNIKGETARSLANKNGFREIAALIEEYSMQ
jgi:hypothetical protein